LIEEVDLKAVVELVHDGDRLRPLPAGELDVEPYLPEQLQQQRDHRVPTPSTACPSLPQGDYVFEVFPGTPGVVNDYTFSLAPTPRRDLQHNTRKYDLAKTCDMLEG
jgi:hypothetical protein